MIVVINVVKMKQKYITIASILLSTVLVIFSYYESISCVIIAAFLLLAIQILSLLLLHLERSTSSDDDENHHLSSSKTTNTSLPSSISSTTTTSTSSKISVPEEIFQEQYPEHIRERLINIRKLTSRSNNENSDYNDDIIMDYYPDVTVLFADISGFTKWCSNCENPQDVFYLLQILYSEFDKLAIKYNIFKVEVIGDCYLAICGAPITSNNINHVVNMSLFAIDIMNKSNYILQQSELSKKLNTSNLQLRIGIHTGPICAGILNNCTKSRYQIFGDTVNTASRMESTSKPGYIQLSEITTKRLSQSYHLSNLIRPRTKIITPKGKGPMFTSWLDYTNTTTVVAPIIKKSNSKKTTTIKKVQLSRQLSNPFHDTTTTTVHQQQQQQPEIEFLKSLEEAITNNKPTEHNMKQISSYPNKQRRQSLQRKHQGNTKISIPSRNLMLHSRSRSFGDRLT